MDKVHPGSQAAKAFRLQFWVRHKIKTPSGDLALRQPVWRERWTELEVDRETKWQMKEETLKLFSGFFIQNLVSSGQKLSDWQENIQEQFTPFQHTGSPWTLHNSASSKEIFLFLHMKTYLVNRGLKVRHRFRALNLWHLAGTKKKNDISCQYSDSPNKSESAMDRHGGALVRHKKLTWLADMDVNFEYLIKNYNKL